MHALTRRLPGRRTVAAPGPNGESRSSERGAALLELAISVPIFVILLALIFDAGLGFSAARDSSSAARSAARVAALAGDDRLADFRALDAIRADFAASDDEIVWIAIYRSPAGGTGLVPADCEPGSTGVDGLCNVYPGSVLDTLNVASFQNSNCTGDPDARWCPTTRELNDGDYLGVGIWTSHTPTVGLVVPADGTYELQDRAVFALYFPDDIG